MTTTNDDDGLRAALARIRPGDEVTVQVEHDGHGGTLSGGVWVDAAENLFVVNKFLRGPDGLLGGGIREVLSHTPAPPPPATVADLDAAGTWAVATDDEGDCWVKREDGMWTFGGSRRAARTLIDTHGPVTLRADGEQA